MSGNSGILAFGLRVTTNVNRSPIVTFLRDHCLRSTCSFFFSEGDLYPTAVLQAGLGEGLADLPDIVLALLQAEAREAHGGLPTAAVLLGQRHRELVEHLG